MAEQQEALPQVIATDEAQTEVLVDDGHGAAHTEHVEPHFIFAPGGWVGLAMLAFILILLWKGVHKVIVGGLDNKIAAIREQLDEAKALRAEAETLRDEYAAKIAGAEKDAAAMLDNARNEADALIAKAETDTAAVIARREQMAQDKIGAEERAAVAALRARAADASSAAAARLIAEKHDADADRKLADETIAAL